MGLTTADYISLGTSAASTGSGIIGGIIANRANAKENQRNREWNEKMWNMTNEYNRPINVVSRYAEAGLNPALALSDGTNSLASYAGNLGTQKAYDNPVPSFNGADIARVHNESVIAQSTENVNNTQASKNTAEEKLAIENAEKVQWENIITSQTYENTINSSLENLEILRKNNLIKEKEYEIKKQELEKERENVRRARAEADTAEEVTNTQRAQTSFIQEQTFTEKTIQARNTAEAYAARTQAELNRATAHLQRELAKNQSYVRENLRADSFQKYMNGALSGVLVGKTQAERNKIIIDAYNALKNGEIERYQKSTVQRYGTSTAGAVLGAIYEFFSQGMPYITDNVSTLVQKAKNTKIPKYDWSNDIVVKGVKKYGPKFFEGIPKEHAWDSPEFTKPPRKYRKR